VVPTADMANVKVVDVKHPDWISSCVLWTKGQNNIDVKQTESLYPFELIQVKYIDNKRNFKLR
jgi:hypothetical protein